MDRKLPSIARGGGGDEGGGQAVGKVGGPLMWPSVAWQHMPEREGPTSRFERCVVPVQKRNGAPEPEWAASVPCWALADVNDWCTAQTHSAWLGHFPAWWEWPHHDGDQRALGPWDGHSQGPLPTRPWGLPCARAPFRRMCIGSGPPSWAQGYPWWPLCRTCP